MPMPDGPVFDAALRIEPGREVVGRLPGLLDIRLEPARSAVELLRERGEVGALLPDALRAVNPEIPPVAGQVGLRRARSAGIVRMPASIAAARSGSEETVGPELDGAEGERGLRAPG
jgi:hypothetical protein